jgi:hypothetical protein
MNAPLVTGTAWRRGLRLAVLLLAGWCVMCFTHEAGHLVGGWAAGGTLREAELRPWRLPHSRFEPDLQPLVTLWAGPLLGALLPLLVWWRIHRPSVRFVAEFCVLANGAYLATAWITGDALLDTPRLLASGAWPSSIAAYCGLTIVWGYAHFRQSCRAVLVDPQGVAKDKRSPTARAS